MLFPRLREPPAGARRPGNGKNSLWSASRKTRVDLAVPRVKGFEWAARIIQRGLLEWYRGNPSPLTVAGFFCLQIYAKGGRKQI